MDIITSLRSNELMDKNFFIGDLENLNKTVNNIVENSQKNQNINANNINNLSVLSSEEDIKNLKPQLGDIYY